MTIATSGDTTDFGDITNLDAYGQYNTGACGDLTYALYSGGNRTTGNNSIHYVTMATPGNSTDFGDLTEASHSHSGTSDVTYGVFMGGSRSNTNRIEYVTIASPGNATDFGDLTSGRYDLATTSGNAS